MFKECHVLRALVTDQIEKAFFRGTWHFGETNPFKPLHCLCLIQVCSVILLSQGFQFPAYGLCPLSRANGGVHNLTLNNQMPVLQGIFNVSNLSLKKKKYWRKGQQEGMYSHPCKPTIIFPDEFLSYRCSKSALHTPLQNIIFKNNHWNEIISKAHNGETMAPGGY